MNHKIKKEEDRMKCPYKYCLIANAHTHDVDKFFNDIRVIYDPKIKTFSEMVDESTIQNWKKSDYAVKDSYIDIFTTGASFGRDKVIGCVMGKLTDRRLIIDNTNRIEAIQWLISELKKDGWIDEP